MSTETYICVYRRHPTLGYPLLLLPVWGSPARVPGGSSGGWGCKQTPGEGGQKDTDNSPELGMAPEKDQNPPDRKC